MRRRIQRKPVKSSQTEFVGEKAPVPARAIKLQDLAGIFTSLSGLLVAILWIAGRYYSAAYFGAMNIPFL